MKKTSPLDDYRKGIITIKELTWDVFIFCIENNPEIILQEVNDIELEALLKGSDSLPDSEQGWRDFRIVGSYCGLLPPEEYAKVVKKRETQIRNGVEIFRKHLKEKDS